MKSPLLLILLTFFLALLVWVSSALFWKNPLILVSALTAVSLAMISLEKDRKDLFLFLAIFIAGPLSEFVMISVGAWVYTTPHILGFPIWLPFLWGNAALFIKRLYFGFKEIENRF